MPTYLRGILTNMAAMTDGMRNILHIIAELAGYTVNMGIHDTAVIEESRLPEDEVRGYIDRLEALGCITIGDKVADTDYRLITITTVGLQAATSSADTNQDLR
jgi:hypothetical protein